MGRTSIKNKLILGFLALLLIVMVVVGVVNRMADDFYIAQAVSTVLAMASGLIFGSIFSRSFVKRLNSLSNAAREISHGDLSKEIPLLSQDEVRDLEEIFARMVNDLRRMISEMKNVSQQIQKTSTSLFNLMEKVLASSHEIDQSAMTIARDSEGQTRIVQKTSIILDNGLNTMAEMVGQSGQTVTKINEARLKTEAGEAKARETLSHLEEVLKQMVEYTQPIYRLVNKVEKINMVCKVIDEIAQKTDLMSLNASIEATRAGELGKGFALVADEIRSMANNSKRSSQEIRKMVEDILEDNKTVTMFLAEGRASIDKGRNDIRGIVSTFSETLTNVKDISIAVRKVEEVTGKQVKELRGLLNHFQELSQFAHENFVSTQKTTVAAKNQKEDTIKIVEEMKALTTLSEKMMENQQRFKLSAAHDTARTVEVHH